MTAHLGSGHGYMEELPSATLWNGSGEEEPVPVSGEQRGFVLQRDSRTFEQHSYTHIPHSWCVTHLSVKPAVTLIFMFLKHTDRLLFFLSMSPIVRQSPLYTAEALTNLFFHWTDMHFNTFGCNNRRCHPCSLFWKIKGHDVILTLSFVSFYSLNDLSIIIKHGE